MPAILLFAGMARSYTAELLSFLTQIRIRPFRHYENHVTTNSEGVRHVSLLSNSLVHNCIARHVGCLLLADNFCRR
jgi:hypothetical protein